MISKLQRLYDALPPAAQGLAIRLASWRIQRQRFGAEFHAALREFERLDGASPDEVRADQERRLQEAVQDAARHVPYYRELFRREGIDPSSIRRVEDLVQIPPLARETLRTQPEALISEAVPKREQLEGRTSGSTGTALRLVHTREALAAEYAAAWRQRGRYGLHLGDRFAAFGGRAVVPLSQTQPPFWRFDPVRQRTLYSLYHMSPENLDAYCADLAKPGHRFWQGYPSSIAWIASHLLEKQIDLGDAGPTAIFTSSESLLDSQRQRISLATGAPIADRYANSELCVSISEHPDGAYRVDTEVCAVEIDARESGDGWVRGEILATGFANRAMPLIRYRTGDIATLRDAVGGAARPVVEAIDGRIEDYVVTPDGRRVGRMDHAFKDTPGLREAQILQHDRDSIRVLLVPIESFGKQARAVVEAELRSRLGHRIAIEFEIVEKIPRLPNGKFRAVISKVGKIDVP